SGCVLVLYSRNRVCSTLVSSSLRRSKRPSQYGQIGRLANCALLVLVVKPHVRHCNRPEILARTVSSETSSQIAASSAVCSCFKIAAKLSACGNVRGNPSNTKP